MVQFQCTITDDNRVPSIVAALEASHPTGFTCELVDHLAFALVTPLCTKHHRGGHDCRALPAIDELAHWENGILQSNSDASMRSL